jgi:XTP/dITP diphosphohydrolase
LKSRALVVATRNPNKVAELRPLLAPVLSILGFDAEPLDPDAPLVPENSPHFAGNAIAKALSAAQWSGEIALGEDSGLEVDALGGAPGVFSARYSGNPDGNNSLVLERLTGVPQGHRTARFRTAAAIMAPDGTGFLAEGVTEGDITETPRGSNGFGYDPIFLSRDLGRTFAEVTPAQKNGVSHRSRALRALRGYLFELADPEIFPGGGGPLPGHRTCLDALRAAGCPSGLIAHQVAVGRVCRELALSLAEAGLDVDTPLLAASGLVHDIGKAPGLALVGVASATGVRGSPADHARPAADWLAEQGFALRLGRTVLLHALDTLLSSTGAPSSLEERALMLVDKLIEQDYVGLATRLAGLAARHPQSREAILASEAPLRRLAGDLAAACRVTEAELERRLAATLSTLPIDCGRGDLSLVRRQ